MPVADDMEAPSAAPGYREVFAHLAIGPRVSEVNPPK
jgi:hypothetical protein